MNTGKSSTVIALLATATVVNAFSAAEKRDGTTKVTVTSNVLIASAGLALVFVGIGQFLSWDLAIVLAAIHLFSTMLTNGLPILNWFVRLIGG